jgi:LmbE family N-acetylglucosaminyl deacetylase
MRPLFIITWPIALIVLFFAFGYLQHLQGQEAVQPQLTLMSVSAHPDDEGGSTLAYYARIKGVKTYSIFFTRGEGGQNEIGSDLYQDLAAIRTKETMEAAKLIGSEVYFLGFPDFGYSKTAKETFPRWGGKDSVVARLVYFIRALKPDVIITNHDTVTTGPNRQHGNHQAVGISAYEAFEKASDPSYHPEQLHDGMTPWQVKKLFVRFYDRDTALIYLPPVTTDVTQKDASGNTMYDIALSALQQHRSQGMLRLSRQQRYYLLRQNRNYVFDNADLFSGIEPSVKERVQIKEQEPVREASTTHTTEARKTTAQVSRKIHVGLVKTYDDTIEQILTSFHINHTLLDSTKLAEEKLDKYSVIVLDLRTYQYRTDALHYNDKLLAYVKSGGNLVVFYNKQDDWNGKNVSPFPLTLTNERVTEEDAPVSMLMPKHRLLSTPNKMTSADWNGWIQERSIYLPSGDTTKTSSTYQRLLAMSDTDEKQPTTSLLWARYGKGTYTYCSLVLYRQLRIANDGAMKLLFNMISQPRH